MLPLHLQPQSHVPLYIQLRDQLRARVDEGAQLIAKLDVQRNVTLRLEMEWKHCLSPSANSTRYWTGARANLSFRDRAGYRRLILRRGQQKPTLPSTNLAVAGPDCFRVAGNPRGRDSGVFDPGL